MKNAKFSTLNLLHLLYSYLALFSKTGLFIEILHESIWIGQKDEEWTYGKESQEAEY